MNLRKIDALVAEQIFGWFTFYDGPELIYVQDIPSTDRQTQYRVAHYSSNIKAAWEVVEKVNILDANTKIVKPSGYRIYRDAYPKLGYTQQLLLGSGDTLPLAICLAALKLKGIDIEKGDE